MPSQHAVVWTDHHVARVLRLEAGKTPAYKVHAHGHATAQHGSGVRTEHEFFGEVCDALEGVRELLVTGGHTALADFRHYAEKHRPLTAARIVAYEVVDHPADEELIALARAFYSRREAMVGVPTGR